VQVDPIKPMLKPPGTQHLKLKCDIVLSTFAFNFNLHHCSAGEDRQRLRGSLRAAVAGVAGAYTRPLLSST